MAIGRAPRKRIQIEGASQEAIDLTRGPQPGKVVTAGYGPAAEGQKVDGLVGSIQFR